MSSIAVIGSVAQPGEYAKSPQPRLVKAAHEFEAQMMNEVLKPLTGSDGITGDEDDSGLGSVGALGGFASEALGRALSEHGGLGIADSIVHSLSHEGSDPAPEAIGKRLGNNTLRNAE
jgi:Rod binding domain-containing protein